MVRAVSTSKRARNTTIWLTASSRSTSNWFVCTVSKRCRSSPVSDSGSTADVSGTKAAAGAAGNSRGGVIQMMKHNLPKGTGFTRMAIALAFAKGNVETAANIASRWKDTTPEVANVLRFGAQAGGTDFAAQIMQAGGMEALQKTAIAAGTTTDTTWAAPLVQYNNMASEFVELLYPMTILGQLQGVRRVPFNIRFPSQTAGASVGWVGQGAAKPVSKLAFATNTLSFAKAAGIVVITQELARFSSPSAEELVRNDLVNTMAQFLDQQFIGPGVAAVANVSPAGITNGITPVQSGGATRALIDADVATA
jgi:HK97 family phage major capsid protein